MTSQTGKQRVAMHMLSNISRIKDNETLSIIRIQQINIFLQKSCRNEPERLVPDLPLILKKALHVVKGIGQDLSFNVLIDFALGIQ